MNPLTYLISVPPKIFPKPRDRLPIDYATDYDDSVFVFEKFGRALSHPPTCISTISCSDLRQYDASVDNIEFTKSFNIGPTVDPLIKQHLIALIHSHWDCFYANGVRYPILGFEFVVNTGTSKPVCCPQPRYGIYKCVIMQKQLDALIHNDWVKPATGPWGSMIVLAPKPHQEDVTDIADFIKRMCVSYRRLNSITLPFKYPIPRCNDAIDDFGNGTGKLSFISLDARSGYHQIAIAPAKRSLAQTVKNIHSR